VLKTMPRGGWWQGTARLCRRRRRTEETTSADRPVPPLLLLLLLEQHDPASCGYRHCRRHDGGTRAGSRGGGPCTNPMIEVRAKEGEKDPHDEGKGRLLGGREKKVIDKTRHLSKFNSDTLTLRQ
jgi:hypothetical protein